MKGSKYKLDGRIKRKTSIGYKEFEIIDVEKNDIGFPLRNGGIWTYKDFVTFLCLGDGEHIFETCVEGLNDLYEEGYKMVGKR